MVTKRRNPVKRWHFLSSPTRPEVGHFFTRADGLAHEILEVGAHRSTLRSSGWWVSFMDPTPSVLPGDRVAGGEPGTEDYDTGTVDEVYSETGYPAATEQAWVRWDSGVSTLITTDELEILA